MDLPPGECAKIVRTHVDALREFFPDVQILVSWVDEDTGNTLDAFIGAGNFYTRLGMAREFLQRDQGQSLACELARTKDPNDEDDDDDDSDDSGKEF